MVQEVSCRSLNSEAVFETMSDHTRFVVGQSGTWTNFSPNNSLFPVNIIPHIFHTCHHLYVPLTRKTYGRTLETSEKQWSFGNQGKLDRKVFSFFQSFHCLFHFKKGQSHANRWSHKVPLHCSFTGAEQIPQTWRWSTMCGCAGIFQTWNSESRWEWLQHTKQIL